MTILLIFVGQVMSAPFSLCSSNQSNSNSMSMMDMPSMPAHDMSTMTSSTESESCHEMDCCDNCQCPIGMCLSQVVYSSDDNINIINVTDKTKLYYSPIFIQKATNSSIYRPPIFC